MRLAHRFAMENEHIRADMIEASEFPQLVQRYSVMAVPKTVVNGKFSVEGALPEAAYAAAVVQAASEPLST